jgi:site-specific DNA-cytosine methylase
MREYEQSNTGKIEAGAPIVIISLFNGMDGIFEAAKIANLNVVGKYYCEIDRDARRVTETRHGDAVLLAAFGSPPGDVKAISIDGSECGDAQNGTPGSSESNVDVLGSFVTRTQPDEKPNVVCDLKYAMNQHFEGEDDRKIVFLLCAGSPCQNLSSAQDIAKFKGGLCGEKSRLFFTAVSILHRLQYVAQIRGQRVVWMFENVASMKPVDRARFTRHLAGRTPKEFQGTEFLPMKRRRLWWTNLDVQPEDEKFAKALKNYSLTLKKKVKNADSGLSFLCRHFEELKNGWRKKGDPTVFTTLLCSVDAAGQKEENMLERCKPDSTWESRHLNAEECEVLMGFERGYSDVFDTSTPGAREKSEKIRRRLLGNSFMLHQPACLLYCIGKKGDGMTFSTKQVGIVAVVAMRSPMDHDVLDVNRKLNNECKRARNAARQKWKNEAAKRSNGCKRALDRSKAPHPCTGRGRGKKPKARPRSGSQKTLDAFFAPRAPRRGP